MKSYFLLYGITLLLSATIFGCTGKHTKSAGADTRDGSAIPVELPALVEGQLIVFENESLRIVRPERRNGGADTLMIQAGNTGFPSFEITGDCLQVEKVMSDYLILSDGDGDIVNLDVYNLRTAKRIAQVDRYMKGRMRVEADNRVLVLMFDEGYPIVEWVSETASWKCHNNVPPHLQAELPALKEKCRARLKDGFRLMAYRKVRICLKECRVEYLSEYEWDDIRRSAK